MRTTTIAATAMLAASSLSTFGQDAAPFHGLYIAGGGSYGISENVTLSTSGTIPGGYSATAPMQGPSALAVAGYNIQHGAAVFGLELSGRFGRERMQESIFATTSSFGVAGTETAALSAESRFGSHLSLRGGVAFSDVMIFGQVGVGATEQTSRVSLSGTGAHCNFSTTIFTPSTFVGGIFTPSTSTVVCGSQTPVIARQGGHSQWLPSALFGIGIEANYGRAFFRLSGQTEGAWGTAGSRITPTSGSTGQASLSRSDDDVLWTTRGVGMIGIRF